MAEFEVQCNTCENVLDADFYVSGSRSILSVDPCETCLETARADEQREGK